MLETVRRLRSLVLDYNAEGANNGGINVAGPTKAPGSELEWLAPSWKPQMARPR